MARPEDSATLQQLRNARTVAERIAALRALKNEIVGHAQLKAEWISLGVLEPIAKTIGSASATARPTVAGRSSPKGRDRASSTGWTLCEQDLAKLQALQVVASFAAEGPAFLPPVHASDILPALFTNISPQRNPPQIVAAALRALVDIVDAAKLASHGCPLKTTDISDAFYSRDNTQSLHSLLILPATVPSWDTIVTLCATLLSRLQPREQHQKTLTSAGVLDALATRLASFAVASGYVAPGAEAIARRDGLHKAFPGPAPRTLKMEPILAAVHAVIGWSKYRAHRFALSPSILAVFPAISIPRGHSDNHLSRGTSPVPDPERISDMLIRDQMSAMDQLLPLLSIGSSHELSGTLSPSTRRPPRSTPSRFASSSVWGSHADSSLRETGEHDERAESPLIPWLICLVREREERERLLAASLLAALFRAGLATRPDREQTIGLLVIPVIVSLMWKHQNQKEPSTASKQQIQQTILEEAPQVLAHLCADREDLQAAACSSGAVPILAKMLKQAYKPVEPQSTGKWWTPNPSDDDEMEVEDDGPTRHMGEAGSNPVMVHQQNMRRIALMGLAALGTTEKHRDAMVKEDIFPHVVESLNEYPREPRASKDKPKDQPFPLIIPETIDPAYGRNDEETLKAACHVIRMLSRSVNILRTSIVDYRVAEQILGLMKHSQGDLQAAATAAMCNLVVDCSPVRELLTEAKVMEILCSLALVNTPALRVNALWALKHWVDAVDSRAKKECLAQLGPEWLLRMLSDEDGDDGADQDALDETASGEADYEPPRWLYVEDGAAHPLDALQCTKLRRAEDQLRTVVDEADDDNGKTSKVRSREVAVMVQEQVLNLIRNLIARPGPSSTHEPGCGFETSDMIDHLLESFGSQRLFDTLAAKLRTRSLGRFSQRGGGDNNSSSGSSMSDRVLVRPQPCLVEPAIYILVHMAASLPRHRETVVQQTDLLRALVPLASGRDSGVRTAVCHLVINLTSADDDDEAVACCQRAQALKELGFLQKLDAMKSKDFDINVRERATTAAWQLEQTY